jgi:photosystem II stability/assembly factor-like uncharacterized protein
MKTKILRSLIVVVMTFSGIIPLLAQGWERVGEDNTPGDSRVPLCILEKDGYVFFGDDHTGVYRWDEASQTWAHLAIPGMNVVYDLLVFEDRLWCTSDGSGVFASDDNGSTWLPVLNGLTHQKVYALTVCGEYLFCGTYHGGIFRYSSATGMWVAVNSTFPYEPQWWYTTELETFDEKVYMFGMGLGIFRTSTVGEDWEPMNNIQYDPNAQVGDFVKHGPYLMIPGDFLGAMRSGDDGETWEFCNNGITSQMDAVSMAATETAVFVGTSDSGLFMSKNHGDNWVAVNLGFPIDWQTQRYANPESMEVIGDYLYTGTWFYGLWRAKLSDLYAGMSGVPDHSEAGNSVQCQIQPNPFKESTEIRYKLTSAGPVSLTVYDIFGNIISALVNCNQVAGEYKINFFPPPGGSVSGGIYYYQLETGGITITGKMLYTPWH